MCMITKRKLDGVIISYILQCGTLEAVDLKLVWFSQACLCQPLADVLTLVTLQLKYFSVFWVFYYCSIAGKFLKTNATI